MDKEFFGKDLKPDDFKSKSGIGVTLCFAFFLVVLLGLSFVGVYNLTQVRLKKEPVFVYRTESYETNENYITVYHTPLYKIIESRGNTTTTYSLKPFFDKD